MKTKDIKQGKGYGFVDETGKLYLKQCFKCGRPNYDSSVTTGQCAWCGDKPKAEYEDQ